MFDPKDLVGQTKRFSCQPYYAGHITITDVTACESGGRTYYTVHGTIVDGTVTNRLFNCTSTTPLTPGRTWEVGGQSLLDLQREILTEGPYL